MRIGVVFPQTEIGADAGAIRAYVDAVGALGYAHVLAYDHVLGADPQHYAGWSGPYDVHSQFHEPFVLFGFLAGICSLELVSGVLVLPQRQTPLVAKQAAAVDVLSQGRLRLGVGLGWNEAEYQGMGADFSTRGRRMEEQIALLRRLWTEPAVDFHGAQHQLDHVGIAPLPVQRPIPIWLGGGSNERSLQRIGRVADGWFPTRQPGAELDERLAIVRDAARAAGRDPTALGIEGRVEHGTGDLERIAADVAAWRAAGATHLSVNTMNAGLASTDDHIAALGRVMGALPVRTGE
jgi:probable F420-dependent oxidoreductase